jgi:hypothetical protein
VRELIQKWTPGNFLITHQDLLCPFHAYDAVWVLRNRHTLYKRSSARSDYRQSEKYPYHIEVKNRPRVTGTIQFDFRSSRNVGTWGYIKLNLTTRFGNLLTTQHALSFSRDHTYLTYQNVSNLNCTTIHYQIGAYHSIWPCISRCLEHPTQRLHRGRDPHNRFDTTVFRKARR